jgi:hypothetical protein
VNPDPTTGALFPDLAPPEKVKRRMADLPCCPDRPDETVSRPLAIVHTMAHGDGSVTVADVMRAAGCDELSAVAVCEHARQEGWLIRIDGRRDAFTPDLDTSGPGRKIKAKRKRGQG